MPQKLNRLAHVFIARYRWFGLALLSAAVGLGLEIFKQRAAADWLLGSVSLISTLLLLRQAYDDVRMGVYGINILAVSAIITAVSLREFWTAIVTVIMVTGGKVLVSYTVVRTKSELLQHLSTAPSTARVLRGKKIRDIPVSQVRIGDRLHITAGEMVPVDATIVEGSGIFDESWLSGGKVPTAKSVGDTLVSGSIAIDSSVVVKAIEAAARSHYQRALSVIHSAASSQAPFARQTDRYSGPFTLLSFVIGGGAWVYSHHALRFLEVIVVATPLPLVAAVPIAFAGGISRIKKQGIIVRTGRAFEYLARARTFAFNKTGTLTEGKPVITAVTAFGGFTADDVLGYAASLESSSRHILGEAITAAAHTRGMKIAKARHAHETPGHGITAVINGKRIIIGRLSFLDKYGTSRPKGWANKRVTSTAAYVAIGGELAGVITFTDPLRPDSKSVLERLKQLGVQSLLIVTGDNTAASQALAKKLGIESDNVCANALPADKLRIIESAPRKPAVFVGDGASDAPVLTAADVGIAFGTRNFIAATESADAIVVRDDLQCIVQGVTTARSTLRIARESVFIGTGLSVILMLVFITGTFRPLYGVFVRELVNAAVIFNALRASTSNG